MRATDSDIAIDLLERSEEIDLLFTDVVMPGKVDGLGLARFADARWPSIAIVVSSGRIVPKPQMLPMGACETPGGIPRAEPNSGFAHARRVSREAITAVRARRVFT